MAHVSLSVWDIGYGTRSTRSQRVRAFGNPNAQACGNRRGFVEEEEEEEKDLSLPHRPSHRFPNFQASLSLYTQAPCHADPHGVINPSPSCK